MNDLDDTQPVPTASPFVDTESLPAGERVPEARPVRRPGRSRLRWGVALVASLLVAVSVAGGALLMTAQAGPTDVLAWTPADRAAYVELRLDLPGSQRAEVAAFLSAFPGFDDQSSLETKIGEALDRLVGEASDGTYDFRSDIDPWFGGTLAMAAGEPAPDGADTRLGTDSLLMLAGVRDEDGARAWVADAVTRSGVEATTETYKGVTVTLVDADPRPGGTGRDAMAFAIPGPVLLLGDPGSVRAAIDTDGRGGLAATPDFATAAASLPGDRVAFLFVESARLGDAASGLPGMLDPGGATDALPSWLEDLSPPWMAAAVRAEGSSLVIETRQPHVAALGPAVNAESALPGLAPSGTVALVVGHGVGSSIQRTQALLGDDPEIEALLDQVEAAAGLLGGIDSLVEWIDELGMVVTRDGDDLSGGIIATSSDPKASSRLFTTLQSFIKLGGGAGIGVREETYAGERISIIDLGSP
jgi:hypothetical protein